MSKASSNEQMTMNNNHSKIGAPAGSVISLKFVQDFMNLYRLKDPMFVLESSDLDEFFLQLKPMLFETIYCLSYTQGANRDSKHYKSYLIS